MKLNAKQIIHDGDIDIKIAGNYLVRYWYLVLVFFLIGAGIGMYRAAKEKTTYTIQAIFKTPESWELVTENSQAVLFQFAKQFSQTYPEYKIEINWTTMPVDNKSNTVNALVYATRTSLTQEQGITVFSKFVADLSETAQVHQMNNNAKKALTQQIASYQNEISAIERNVVKFIKLTPSEKTSLYTTAFDRTIAVEKEIDNLAQIQQEIGALQWLTEPNPATTKTAKPWYLFVVSFGGLGAIFGSFLAILPGLAPSKHGKKI